MSKFQVDTGRQGLPSEILIKNGRRTIWGSSGTESPRTCESEGLTRLECRCRAALSGIRSGVSHKDTAVPVA